MFKVDKAERYPDILSMYTKLLNTIGFDTLTLQSSESTDQLADSLNSKIWYELWDMIYPCLLPTVKVA